MPVSAAVEQTLWRDVSDPEFARRIASGDHLAFEADAASTTGAIPQAIYAASASSPFAAASASRVTATACTTAAIRTAA